MDPNQALKELRRVTYELLAEDLTHAEWLAHAQLLAERFNALDEWLTKGGFFPDIWAKGRQEPQDPEPQDFCRGCKQYNCVCF